MIGPRLQAYVDAHRITHRIVSCEGDSEGGSTVPEGTKTTEADEPGAPAAVGTWVLAVGERYVLLVLPQGRLPPPELLCPASGRPRVRLASEAEIEHLFPDCDHGAIPPCGEPYGVPVYVSDKLAAETALLCPAGRHDRWLHVDRAAFDQLARPHWTKLPPDAQASERIFELPQR